MNKQKISKNYRNSNINRKNSRNLNDFYYNSSSEAFKYSPNYQPQYEPKIKKKTKIKIKEKYVIAEKNEKIFSLKFFIMIGIFAMLGTTFVGINAKILEKKFQIDELNTKLKEVKENNKNLETEIAKNLDLEYIENYASKNLKMQKPAAHQIIHISVPKESYTIKSENTNNKNKD